MADTVLEDQGVVLRRVYPAEVVLPHADGQAASALTKALVIVTEERAYVWTAPGDPVFSQPWDRDASSVPHESRMRTDGATITTPAGVLIVHRGRGCGCGSKLRGYQPWPAAQAGVLR